MSERCKKYLHTIDSKKCNCLNFNIIILTAYILQLILCIFTFKIAGEIFGRIKIMRTTVYTFILGVLTLVSGMASAGPITIISQQGFWDYNVTSTNIDHTIFPSYDFSDFTSNYTGALNGKAGFGNRTPPAGGATNTIWTAGTDLALQTTATLAGNVIGDVTLSLATDNGAIVFINGTEVFSEMAEGYTNIWEYTATVSGGLFNAGANTISVLAEDHGGATFFDMQLVAEGGISSAVPEPSIIALFGLGILGLGFARRRKA